MWPFTRWRFDPGDVEVEFTECRSVAVVLVHGFPAGRASVHVEGDTAQLIDLHIYEHYPHWHPWLRLFWVKMNYQDRGLGSRLLRAVLEDLASRGVHSVWGDMHGDPVKLPRFYRRHGLTVDEAREHIEIGLVTPQPALQIGSP